MKAQFENFARIWMQRPMCLRGISGIAFKRQFDAYFAILAERYFLPMTKYYFHYAHMQLQSDEDTGSKT